MGETAAKTQEVIVVWGRGESSDGDTFFGILAWDSGRGPPRVYDKDHYDPRCDLGRDEADGPMPYFSEPKEAYDYAVANEGEPFQLDVQAARRMGLIGRRDG